MLEKRPSPSHNSAGGLGLHSAIRTDLLKDSVKRATAVSDGSRPDGAIKYPANIHTRWIFAVLFILR